MNLLGKFQKTVGIEDQTKNSLKVNLEEERFAELFHVLPKVRIIIRSHRQAFPYLFVYLVPQPDLLVKIQSVNGDTEYVAFPRGDLRVRFLNEGEPPKRLGFLCKLSRRWFERLCEFVESSI